MEEAKKMKCYKRLIFKQFVQVSGLCGPKFLSYLPKRFTHLCRALNGDAMSVHRFGAPISSPENNENIWSSLFLKNLFLFTRELAYMRTEINLLTLEMVILLKIKRTDFFRRDSIPVLVSRTVKIWKFKLLYFRNETC